MSVFYRSVYERPYPITLLALERFYHLQDAGDLEEAILRTLIECCGCETPTEDDARYFLDRFAALAEEVKSKQPEPEPSTTRQEPPSKTLHSSLHELYSSLPTDRMLLWMCGYDYQRAQYLYTRVDRDDVMKMIEDWLSVNLEQARSQFEAALYGAGGSYKSDASQPEEGVVDLSKSDGKEMKAALKGIF